MKKYYNSLLLILLFQLPTSSAQVYEVQYKDCWSCFEDNHDISDFNWSSSYYDPSPFLTSHVTSDYGPRNYNGYDWHGGIDYSNEGPPGANDDFGDAILAIRGGTIAQIGQRQYKYIVINGDDINEDSIHFDFGYGHIFTSATTNQQSGVFHWQKILGRPDDYAIITSDNTALFTESGLQVIHPETDDTLTTINTVGANDPIAPMGNSITYGTVSVHLHLYMFENNDFRIGDEYTKNPLTHCVHDTPTYTLEIFSQFQPLLPGFKFNYPGIDSSQILVKAIIDSVDAGYIYNEAVMNLEKTQVYVSSNNQQDSKIIIGFNFQSSIRYDGILNDTTYDRHPDDLETRGEAENGHTGILPRAYSGGAWDYFNYADFFTRIHKDDLIDASRTYADVPAHTRYNDGPYEFKAVVTDVRGNEHVGPVDSNGQLQVIRDTLDNFMPFVESVSVEINNEEAYFSESKSIDNNLTIADDGYVQLGPKNNIAISELEIAWPGNIYEIIVTTSEPMDTVNIWIPELEDQGPYTLLEPTAVDTQNNIYKFTFTEGDLDQNPVVDSCYSLIISGMDFSGNHLINLQSYLDSNINNIKIPKRIDTSGVLSNDWIDIDTAHITDDTYHSFCINECGVSNLSGVSINSQSSQNLCYFSVEDSIIYVDEELNQNGKIILEIDGYYEEIIFTDQAGNILQSGQSNVLINLAPGVYCYEVKEGCCSISKCVAIQSCINDDIIVLSESIECFDSVRIELGFSSDSATILETEYDIEWYFSNNLVGTGNNFLIAEGYNYEIKIKDRYNCSYSTTYQTYLSYILPWISEWNKILICGENYQPSRLEVMDLNLNIIDSFKWLDNGSTDIVRHSINRGYYCIELYLNDCRKVMCEYVDSINWEPRIILENIQQPYCDSEEYYACDGSIDISVEWPLNMNNNYCGQEFDILWTFPNGDTTSQEDLSGLCPSDGYYTVRVTSPNCPNCFEIRKFRMCCCGFSLPSDPQNPSQSPLLCESEEYLYSPPEYTVQARNPKTWYSEDGWIYISLNDPLFSGIIEWSGPDDFYSNSFYIGGLKAGTYCATFSIMGCPNLVVTECITLESCEDLDIDSIASITHACNNTNNGSITLDPQGGNEPYTFNWNTGQSTNQIENLSPGEYCVTITEAFGCRDTFCFEVNNYSNIVSGYKDDETNLCYIVYECADGTQYAEPVDDICEWLDDCRHLQCRCPVSNTITVDSIYDLVDVDINDDCSYYEALCPSDGSQTGGIPEYESKYEWIGDTEGCCACYYIEYCSAGGVDKVINAQPAEDPFLCTPDYTEYYLSKGICYAIYYCNINGTNTQYRKEIVPLSNCSDLEQDLPPSSCQLFFTSNDSNIIKLIHVFPNPTNDLLFIEGNIEISQVKLYSVDGKLITDDKILVSLKEDHVIRVNVFNLPSGIYFINIIDQKGNKYFKKFVKA